jgi:hypothetical protein
MKYKLTQFQERKIRPQQPYSTHSIPTRWLGEGEKEGDESGVLNTPVDDRRHTEGFVRKQAV